jgi:hypothetical protein
MSRLLAVSLAVCALTLSISVYAEEADDSDVHPWLSDGLLISVGAFMPSKEIKLTARGSIGGQNQRVDLDQTFIGSTREDVLAINVHWRFGKRWWLSGEWYQTRFEGKATLEDDIYWNGVIFPAGSSASAGFSTDLTRVVLGRQVYRSERSDVGVGLGLHILELGAFIEGKIVVTGNQASVTREAVKASAPLPNLTAWYVYSWSPKWALVSRVDWLSASFKEYSGQILNANAGVHYQFADHLGLVLAYKYFSLDVDIDKRGWYGASKYSQSGIFASLTTNW